MVPIGTVVPDLGVDQVIGVPADISRTTIDRPGARRKQVFLALDSPITSLEEG